jgi:O-antigen ligase
MLKHFSDERQSDRENPPRPFGLRRITRILLLLFAFTIPWEYSLDLGEPLGNAARIAGILVLLAAAPAIFQAGRMRTPCLFCWITLALYLWFCCTCYWSIDAAASLIKLRAYFQEMMIVWLVWEFADTPDDLRDLLRAAVAGSCVLALLTLAAFSSPEAIAAGQIRFAAYGQDPNDVARFLDLGFPLAALLVHCERRWPMRLLALGSLPLGAAAVLLTASRSGFLAALVALGGALALLAYGHARRVATAAFALPPLIAILWFIVPAGTIQRLATIPGQLQGGDLNQRVNIWTAGWSAFTHSPLLGSGAGTFVAAAQTAPGDSAHNTMLSILVTGGLCALFLASLLVVLAARAALHARGPLRMALVTCLIVWAVTTLIATVEENRITWLLFGILILAARLSDEEPAGMAACFRFATPRPLPAPAPVLAIEPGS